MEKLKSDVLAQPFSMKLPKKSTEQSNCHIAGVLDVVHMNYTHILLLILLL